MWVKPFGCLAGTQNSWLGGGALGEEDTADKSLRVCFVRNSVSRLTLLAGWGDEVCAEGACVWGFLGVGVSVFYLEWRAQSPWREVRGRRWVGTGVWKL